MRDALSERGAFKALIASAVVLGLVALVGWLTGGLFGGLAALALAALLAALIPLRLLLVRRVPPAAVPRPAPPPDPRRPGARHRILVVANEALGGPALRRELLRRLEIWPEVFVLAPVLCSRIHYWASDSDTELEAARDRLEEVLAWAREHGFAAGGEVGADAVQSVEDALARICPDEAIVAVHPPERLEWLEAKVVEEILRRPALPVTLVVEHGAGREEIARPPALAR